MIILINTASTFDGGAIQVALSVIEECRTITGHEYHVLLGLKLSEYIKEDKFPSNFHFYRIPYRPATRVFSFRSRSRYFRQIEQKVNPEIVFTTSGPAYWQPARPHLCGFNIPQSVYPESPYFKLISGRERLKWTWDKYVRRHFFKREGKFFVVQTDDVNSRLRLWFRTDKVFTVSNTCNSYYLAPTEYPNKLPQKEPGEFRFISFSTYRTHKNLGIIKEMVELLPDDIKLKIRFVLTIPQVDFESLIPKELRSYIYNAGPVKVNEGPSLYKECDAAFIPTLLECFSASYAEAMAMGIPIASSDLSFARAICKDAARYFNPLDPGDAIKAVLEIYNSETTRKLLISSGKGRLKEFGSASERAQSYINLCSLIVKKDKLHQL